MSLRCEDLSGRNELGKMGLECDGERSPEPVLASYGVVGSLAASENGPKARRRAPRDGGVDRSGRVTLQQTDQAHDLNVIKIGK